MNREIVVASMPRCGSTMLCRVLEGLPQKSTWNQNAANKVWKTHRFGSKRRPFEPEYAIYLFGDPLLAVLSTLRRFKGDLKHFRNCGCEKPLDQIDIIHNDDMNLEKSFDYWYNESFDYPKCCVRYETMWEHQGDLSEFLGEEVELPDKKQRSTKLRMKKQLMQTYGDLVEKIEEAEDFKID